MELNFYHCSFVNPSISDVCGCARGVIIYIFIVKSEIVQNFVIFDRSAAHSGGPAWLRWVAIDTVRR